MNVVPISHRTRAVLFVLGSSLAQAAPGMAQTPPPPSPTPAINRVNEALPQWLRLRAELRERVEGFEGAGFVENRDDLYWLTRFRLNAVIAPGRLVSFQLQVQDARVADKHVGSVGTPFKAPFDARLAFVDVGRPTAHVALRLGRQELAFGEQRLVGHVSWLNAARTFDGARVTAKRGRTQVDAFATSLVRIMDGAFDRSGHGNVFAGAYITSAAVVPKSSLEPFVFWRRERDMRAETGTLGTLHQTTAGVRWTGALPARFDYGTEMAVQAGTLASDSLAAWAGHWQLRHSIPGARAAKVAGEYNYASGDGDGTDGTRATFDQLFPTPHDKYGLADQVGWKNIHHLRAGVDVLGPRRVQITGNYHSWWLANSRDALYAASGAVLARVAGGASSAHVGHELDVQFARALTPQLQLAGGVAHIFPGAFLRQATPGASHTYPYVMATYVFLADR